MNGSSTYMSGRNNNAAEEYSDDDMKFSKFEKFGKRGTAFKSNADKSSKKKWKPRQNVNFDIDGF